MTTTPGPVRPRTQVTDLAAQHLARLQRGYLADRSREVADLARLRRGAGRGVGELPDLWGLIDTAPLHEPPAGTRPLTEGELVRAEDALHAALTLWALHQQSRPIGMHQADRSDNGRGLGAAVRRMMTLGEIDEPLRKRLVRAGTAPDLTALAQRLRDIVLLLRRDGIALDYALLAGQLYTWQHPGGPDTVRREWGRSFHTRPDRTSPGDTATTPGNTAPTAVGDTHAPDTE
ncbi:type I-E CRISPR-associated protein Cse2/CasB [Streptomyces sp. NPDC058247]|uniref:type I-E CRISPR-associated protein Cse2/CasB n=1 Tax=Streptomyces sp. NPDC058247 TaxID=3346401 RepID=UPI0036E07AB2